ncbi:MAG TPA: hypothetical protein VIM11_05065 [Tepidisphaeraceae bacterium]|jgi:hypothetical protein
MAIDIIDEMFGPSVPPDERAKSLKMLVRFTVEQYHQMLRAGILEEGAPIELLGGLLFYKDRGTAGAEQKR